jgi:hypothetical protein
MGDPALPDLFAISGWLKVPEMITVSPALAMLTPFASVAQGAPDDPLLLSLPEVET